MLVGTRGSLKVEFATTVTSPVTASHRDAAAAHTSVLGSAFSAAVQVWTKNLSLQGFCRSSGETCWRMTVGGEQASASMCVHGSVYVCVHVYAHYGALYCLAGRPRPGTG